MTKMTKSEWERALSIGRKNPKASPEEIAKEAKIPQVTIELAIPLDRETNEALSQIAKNRKIDTVTLVRSVIDDFLD